MLGWELPPHNSGGLGIACYQMSKALAYHGASIDFVVPYPAEYSNIDFMNIVPVTDVPITKDNIENLYFGAYDHGTPGNPAEEYGLSGMREIQRKYCNFVVDYVKKYPPEAIHAHDWLTMEAGVRAKAAADVPLIVHVHATEYDRSGEFLGNPLVHEIEQHGLMMADRIIAVSHITKDIIVKNYQIPADKVEVVYNAIDLDTLPPHQYDYSTYSYLESLKSQDYTIVGTLTRLTVQKGLGYFVKAAAKALAQNEKMAFVLLGSGEQRDELISLAADLGIADKFIFGGFVRGKQWRDAYHLLDIFVMSSVSEPFGLTALEAAHHDTALLISKQSGVGEVLENILQFDYWDTDKMAQQMVDVSTNPILQESLKRKVKEEYVNISWRDAAHKCLELYKSARRKGIDI